MRLGALNRRHFPRVCAASCVGRAASPARQNVVTTSVVSSLSSKDFSLRQTERLKSSLRFGFERSPNPPAPYAAASAQHKMAASSPQDLLDRFAIAFTGVG